MKPRPPGLPKNKALCDAPGCDTPRARYSKSGLCRSCGAVRAQAKRRRKVPCVTPGCRGKTSGRGVTGLCRSCNSKAILARPEVKAKLSVTASAWMHAQHARPGVTDAMVARMNAARDAEACRRSGATRSEKARRKVGLGHVDDLAWQGYLAARRKRIGVEEARQIALDDHAARQGKAVTGLALALDPETKAAALALIGKGVPARQAVLQASAAATARRVKKAVA